MLIRRKLPIFSILIILIAMTLSGMVYYIYIHTVLLDNNDQLMNQITEMGGIALENFFESRKVELTYLAKNDRVQQVLVDYEEQIVINPNAKPIYTELNTYFINLVNTNRDISHAFIIGLDGRVVASSKEQSYYLDLSDRQYFIDALEGRTTISNLLQDRVDGLSVLFVATPVYRTGEGGCIGVIANIVGNENVLRSIDEMIDPTYGVAYLLDGNQQVVFHKEYETIGSFRMFEGFEAFYQNDMERSFSTNVQHEDGEQLITARKIHNTSLVLVVEQNRDRLLQQSRQALFFMGWVNIVIIITVGVISLLFAKSITTPISQISSVMNKTIHNDLSIRVQHIARDELGQLASDLNHMLDELVGAYEEVENKNEELLAIEEELRDNNEELALSKREIEKIAFINPLTRLPNRLAFGMDMRSLIHSKSTQSSGFSVYQMDIDNFMRINDSLGHKFGDEILKMIGERLNTFTTKNLKLYHLSADEFAFIDQSHHDEVSIRQQIKHIYEAFNRPYEYIDRMVYISVSTGISTYPNDGLEADVIVQNADTAMFEAKNSGKANYIFYRKIMSDAVRTRIEIEDTLRVAVKEGWVYAQLQPQCPVKERDTYAFEALMRLKKPDGQIISPAQFIPISEETGQIIELGYWMFEEIAKLIGQWRHLGYHFSHISVNVSAVQLKQKDFVERIRKIVEINGVRYADFELEVTESMLVTHYEEENEVLRSLKELGFKIALDDFGTGYSSFGYLSHMPLTTLKIDKIFIDNIVTSYKDDDLVRQMIRIAHDLNLFVVAEGVETADQLEILTKYNCDFIQGYYFSKPMDIEVAEKWIAEK